MPAMTHTMQGILCRKPHISAAAGQAKGKCRANQITGKSEGSWHSNSLCAIKYLYIRGLGNCQSPFVFVDSFQSCTKPSVWQGKLNPESIGFLSKTWKVSQSLVFVQQLETWLNCSYIMWAHSKGFGMCKIQHHVVFESRGSHRHMYKKQNKWGKGWHCTTDFAMCSMVDPVPKILFDAYSNNSVLTDRRKPVHTDNCCHLLISQS